MNGISVLNPSFDPSLPCPRCQGFRISEGCYDFQDRGGPRWIYSLRCINCGSVEDPIIVQHQRLVQLPPPRRNLPGSRIGAKLVLRGPHSKPVKRRRV